MILAKMLNLFYSNTILASLPELSTLGTVRLSGVVPITDGTFELVKRFWQVLYSEHTDVNIKYNTLQEHQTVLQ